MRILVVNMPGELWSSSRAGAVTRVIHQTARRWIELGHEVVVLSQCDDEPLAGVAFVPLAFSLRNSSLLDRLGGRLSLYEGRLRRRPVGASRSFVSAVKAAMREVETPDVIVFHNDLHTAARFTRTFPEALRVTWVHNALTVEGWTEHGRRKVVRSSDLLICVSEYIREHLCSSAPVSKDAMRVALNGVDSATFRPARDHEIVVPEAPLEVITVGRIDPAKGTDLLAAAIKRLQREGTEAHLTVVGDQWWYGNDSAVRSDFTNRVLADLNLVGARWTGHVAHADVARHLAGADVFVDASRVPNPCPLSMLEAMASGLTVISAASGGNPELLQGSGILLEAAPEIDPAALAAALRQLHLARELLAERGSSARVRASALTWNATADEALDAIGSALAKRAS